MMVAQADNDEEQERARLQPFVDQLIEFIRQRDSDATFAFDPGPDAGIWVLDAYLTPPLNTDIDFHTAIANLEVDFMIEHGVHIATVMLPRSDRAGAVLTH